MFLLCATAAGVFSTIGYVILAVVCLMLMVVIHELGHYTAGKLLGFKINEFAIGFGPPIYKRTSKKTGEVFSIRPFPLGGFCQFEGEDKEGESEYSFNNHAPWKRLIVLFSGAFLNFISSIVLITLIFTFYGQLLPTVYEDPAPESYVAQNDILRKGDVITKVNGRIVNILLPDDINKAFARIGTNDEGTFTILRNGKKMTVTVKRSEIYQRGEDGEVLKNEDGTPKTRHAFGFVSGLSSVKLNFFTALGRSFSYGFYVVFKIISLLGMLITGQLSFTESAGGPITIVSSMSEAGRNGLGSLLYVVCIISANLAVMNILPLPALDGSRMLFTIIEWIFKKPINRKVEGIIHTVGIFVMFAFAIFADILHLIK